jgi:geranylgeranyl pyrophosphate synthase
LDQALAPIQQEMARVAERVLESLIDPVAQRVVYLITAGGKRLRPALVLLCGRSGGPGHEAALIDAAAAVELIHTATLIHDDIIDQSRVRRAQPSFHHRWGTERAVLMGDYLYATAFSLLAGLPQPEAIRIMAEVCRYLCRGELREVEARFRLDLSEQEYLDIIRDKTASLISGCCRAGALLGGCSKPLVEDLAQFGLQFGMAFQIVDDCLDLTGDQREMGKSIHADLDKGALSLPIIYLTQRLSARDTRELFAPLKERGTDPSFVAEVARRAQACGAIDQALARAEALMRKGMKALRRAPLNGLRNAYEQLAAYAVSRRS